MCESCARLQAAKRRALAIADERGKEANALRAALTTIKCHLYAIPPTAPWIADCRGIADAALAHEQSAAEGGKNG